MRMNRSRGGFLDGVSLHEVGNLAAICGQDSAAAVALGAGFVRAKDSDSHLAFASRAFLLHRDGFPDLDGNLFLELGVRSSMQVKAALASALAETRVRPRGLKAVSTIGALASWKQRPFGLRFGRKGRKYRWHSANPEYTRLTASVKPVVRASFWQFSPVLGG